MESLVETRYTRREYGVACMLFARFSLIFGAVSILSTLYDVSRTELVLVRVPVHHPGDASVQQQN